MSRVMAIASLLVLVACSGGANTQGPTATPVSMDGATGATTVLGGLCPGEGDAAPCPELGGQAAWVGCTRITAGTNTGAFQSCTCFATGTGEAAWACKVSGLEPDD